MTKRIKAMTLLEVLVALAIFATAAISVIRATTQHSNTLSYLEEKTFASMVVDNVMAKVILAGSLTSERSGKSQMAGREWYWTAKPVATATDYIAAFDVSVSTDQEQESTIVTVRSYVNR